MNKKILSVVAVILLGIGGYIVITGNYGVEDSGSKSPVGLTTCSAMTVETSNS